MICFEGASADALWRQAIQRLHAEALVQESRDQPTRELLHVAFTLTDPRQRLVFSRAINPAFAIAEVIWILSGGNDVDYLRFWNPRMNRFTDDEDPHRFHGAYGYRLGSQPHLSEHAAQQLRRDPPARPGRVDQLRAAYEALRDTPHSRQVVLQIWDHRLDLPDPQPRSRDVPCNLMSHLLLRDGKLEWLQVMRSNDLVWGTPYNFIQFTTIQEIVAGWLGAEVGTYTHISDSLHAYERHWDEVRSTATGQDTPAAWPVNRADARIAGYSAWEQVWQSLVDGAIELTRHTASDELLAVARTFTALPPAYAEWGMLLTAEALRRRGHLPLAMETVSAAGPFWSASWRTWAAAAAARQTTDERRPSGKEEAIL